jgi:hypothetical protein
VLTLVGSNLNYSARLECEPAEFSAPAIGGVARPIESCVGVQGIAPPLARVGRSSKFWRFKWRCRVKWS